MDTATRMTKMTAVILLASSSLGFLLPTTVAWTVGSSPKPFPRGASHFPTSSLFALTESSTVGSTKTARMGTVGQDRVAKAFNMDRHTQGYPKKASSTWSNKQMGRRMDDKGWQNELNALASDASSNRKELLVLLRSQTEPAIRNGGTVQIIRASQVVDVMHQANMTLPTVSYNAVLRAWKKYAASQLPHVAPWERAVQQAGALVDEMARRGVADVVSYSTLISIWALRDRQPQAAQKALEIYESMQMMHGIRPNARTRNAVLRAFCHADLLPQAVSLFDQWEAEDSTEAGNHQLSTVCYATLMTGFSRSQRIQDPTERLEAVHRIWNRLWERYEKLGTAAAAEYAQPNLYALTIYLGVCTQTGTPRAAQMAQDAFFRLYELQRQRTVETGRTWEGDDTDIEEDDDDEEDASPTMTSRGAEQGRINSQVLTQVLDAWQKSRDPMAGQRATDLVKWVVQEFRDNGDERLRPNAYTFSTAIGAWCRSRRIGKAEQARALLVWMRELYEEGLVLEPPNTYCYTGVISTAAYVEKESLEQRRALDVAIKTYNELRQPEADDTPTHVTYAAFLTALRNLVPPSPKRVDVARKVFADASSNGQVCPLVLQRLESAVFDQVQMHEILSAATDLNFDTAPDKMVSLEQIPAYWRRNVKISRQRR